MNLGTMRTSVIENLGTLASDPYFTTAILNGFINKSLRKIDSEFEWPWNQKTGTLTTVIGQQYVAAPADWQKTRLLSIDGSEPFELVSLNELRNEGLTGQSQPYYYAVEDDRIYLRPVPNAVFTIIHDYTSFEPGLTSDADTPRLPVSYHDAVVDLALYYACLKANETSRADRYRESYKDWVQTMKRDVRRTLGPFSVVPRPGGWI